MSCVFNGPNIEPPPPNVSKLHDLLLFDIIKFGF